MQKNVAGQFMEVVAYNRLTDQRVSGEAANITATISKDGAAFAATDDVNPTEIDSSGIYKFALLQAESNCDLLIGLPACSTVNVECQEVVIRPRPQPIVVGPIVAGATAEHLVGQERPLALFRGEAKTFVLTVTDASGSAVDLIALGSAFKFIIETRADIPVVQLTLSSGMTISGAGNNVLTIPLTSILTRPVNDGLYNWLLWDTTGEDVLLHGPMTVLPTSEPSS